MEEARRLFKEKVNQTKLFFTKEKKQAEKISYKQFDGIIIKLGKLLAKCNGDDKEELNEDDKWTEDVESAIKQHGEWSRFDSDMKKFKEKWQMNRFQEEFIIPFESDDEDNSRNKNKKRSRSKSIEVLKPSKKKRKQNDEVNDINDEEVCLMILFIPNLLLSNSLRFSITCHKRKDLF